MAKRKHPRATRDKGTRALIVEMAIIGGIIGLVQKPFVDSLVLFMVGLSESLKGMLQFWLPLIIIPLAVIAIYFFFVKQRGYTIPALSSVFFSAMFILTNKVFINLAGYQMSVTSEPIFGTFAISLSYIIAIVLIIIALFIFLIKLYSFF